MRKRHVAAGFPIADGLRFFEFAGKGGFRANVEPESEVRAQGHSVKAGEIVAVDAAHDAARNKGEDKAVGKDDGAFTEYRDNSMFELVEEVGGVHQRQGEACDGVFGEQLVNVAAHKIRTPQAAGDHRETFGFQPFLEQRDLRGASGTVHAFDDDERTAQFARIEAHKRLAEKSLRGFGLSRWLGGSFDRCGCRDRRLFFFLVGHGYSASGARGAKRLRSILEATISRICFWSLFTGRVPSRTTKLSVSTILSYSSRMRAWKSLKLSGRS